MKMGLNAKHSLHFTVKFMFLIICDDLIHFQFKVIIDSNYTRVFLSSDVEQWKLVHLISVFLYLIKIEVIHCAIEVTINKQF